MRVPALLLAAAAFVASAPALAATPELHATPQTVAMALQPGITKLTDKADAYVPKSVTGAAPLVVVLDGGGASTSDMMNLLKPEADHRGAVLLLLTPSAGSFTLKPDPKGGADLGPDLPTLDAALTALYAKAPVDPERSVLLGYADGASYALSLGLWNPKIFSGVVAMTPGTVFAPSLVDKSQHVFVSHGMRDETYPFKNTRDRIVPGLQAEGVQVITQWPNEGHGLDKRMVTAGLDATLGKAR